jgi:hypothetical protein
MKKALCVIAMLGIVATASATYSFYAVPASEAAPLSAGDSFITAETDFTGLANEALFPAAAGGPYTIDQGMSEIFYIYMNFNDETANVNGIHLNARATNGGNLLQGVGYQSVWFAGALKRWDPGVINISDDQLSGIFANISFQGVNLTFQANDGLLENGIALLGAVEFECPAGGCGLDTEFQIGLANQGVAVGPNYDPAASVELQGQSVPGFPGPDNTQWVTVATGIPEPASLLLIGLGALALRRR